MRCRHDFDDCPCVDRAELERDHPLDEGGWRVQGALVSWREPGPRTDPLTFAPLPAPPLNDLFHDPFDTEETRF